MEPAPTFFFGPPRIASDPCQRLKKQRTHAAPTTGDEGHESGTKGLCKGNCLHPLGLPKSLSQAGTARCITTPWRPLSLDSHGSTDARWPHCASPHERVG